MGPALADRESKIRGDPLREVEIDVNLLRAVETGRWTSDGRERHLVGDKGIVGQNCRREEPLTGKAVGRGVLWWKERGYCQRDAGCAGGKAKGNKIECP